MVLEKIVLEAVRSLADYVRCYEPVFLYFLAMQNNAEHQMNLKALRQSIDKGEQRIRQIDKAIEELFEANICGKITDERCKLRKRAEESDCIGGELEVRA